MKSFSGFNLLTCLSLAAAFAVAGCHSNQQADNQSGENSPQQLAAQGNAVDINRMGPPRTAEQQVEPVYPETNRPPQQYAQPMRSQASPGEPTLPQSNSEEPSRVASPPIGTAAEVHRQPYRPAHSALQPLEPGQAQPAPAQQTLPSRSAPHRPQPE